MATSPRRIRLFAFGSLAALALAACGTTVPLASQLAPADSGGVAAASGGLSGAADPTVAGGTSTSTTGTTDAAAAPTGSTSGDATTAAGSSTSGTTPTVGSAPIAGTTTTTASATGTARRTGTQAGNAKTTTTTTGTKKATTAPNSAKPKAGTAVKAASAAPVSTPLQLGFLDTETGNASALGLNTGMTFSYPQIINGLVRAVNAQGGVGGRQITPIIATTDTASSNWATDFQAACSKFSQDNHVAAVLGYEFDFLPSFEQCLNQAGIPHLNEAYASGGNGAFTTYPGLFSLAVPSVDRQDILNISGPLTDGELTAKNKIGVIADTCGDDASAYTNTMVPYIKSHGLDLAATTTLTCAGGVGDAASGSAAVSSAVLSFRSAGVDRVVVSGVPAVVFMTAAQSQGYTPDYIVTSTTGGGLIESNVPAQQLAHVHGYGWLPAVDVDLSHQPAQTAPQRKCLSLLASQQIVPSQFGDYFPMYTTCDALFAYQAAVTAVGNKTDAASVIAGLAGLGTAYQDVNTLGGSSALAANHHDAPTTYQPWSYQAGCSCFQYIESAKPFPTS